MVHWIVYHNPDVVGGSPKNRFFAVSDRRASVAIGDTVWLVEGVGSRPRTYRLVLRFVVEHIDRRVRPQWQLIMRGSTGRHFAPRPVLNGFAWFPAFRREHGNFAFGLRRIRPGPALRGLMGQ